VNQNRPPRQGKVMTKGYLSFSRKPGEGFLENERFPFAITIPYFGGRFWFTQPMAS